MKEFRARAKELSDEVLVVLVGDMVTEEALPTYQTLLNTFEGACAWQEFDYGRDEPVGTRGARGWIWIDRPTDGPSGTGTQPKSTGVDDPTGTSQSAWCKWTRGWTSEENRCVSCIVCCDRFMVGLLVR